MSIFQRKYASTILRFKSSFRAFKHYLQKTIYATRHSFASSIVGKNMPITLTQKYLGHTKFAKTMDYYVKNGLMDITNIDKGIDRLFA